MVFTALIVSAQFFNRQIELLYPDDREQIAAERADTDNNAFFVLRDAQALLPPRSVLSNADVEPVFDGPVSQGGKYSIPTMLGIPQPPGHPDLQDYLKESEPAIELARTALEKPYFLYPIPAAHWNLRTQLPQNIHFSYLYTVWFAYGEYQIMHWNDLEGGIQTLSELLSTQSKLEREPLLIHSRWQYFPFSFEFFKMLQRLIRQTDDPKILDALDDLLKTHPPVYDELTSLFNAHMRALDDTLMLPQLMPIYAQKEAQFDLDDRIELYQMQNVTKWYSQHVEHFQNPDNLMPAAYAEWLSTKDWDKVPWSDYSDMHVTLQIQEDLRRAWQVMDAPRATRIVIALHRHFLANGANPQSLDELVPDYIDAIPESVISDDPFDYNPGRTDVEPHAYSIRGAQAPWFVGWDRPNQYVALEFVVPSEFY